MRVHTLVTSMFSQQDIWHLASNMVTFYFFAPTVASLLGRRAFLGLYFGGGISSSLTHILWPYCIPSSWPARYKSSVYAPAMGASGAINALIIYSILTFPRQIIYVNLILPMPAILFGGLFIFQDVYGLYYGDGRVGNAAHLGGAFFGASYFMLRRIRRR